MENNPEATKPVVPQEPVGEPLSLEENEALENIRRNKIAVGAFVAQVMEQYQKQDVEYQKQINDWWKKILSARGIEMMSDQRVFKINFQNGSNAVIVDTDATLKLTQSTTTH